MTAQILPIRTDTSKLPTLGSFAMTAAHFAEPLKPITFIDDMLVPRGLCTALMTPPGSGKTTAQTLCAIVGSLGQGFPLFGSGKSSVGKKLRSLLILGEDTRQTLRSNLEHLPVDSVDVAISVGAGTIVFAPLLDAPEIEGDPEFFGQDGKLSERGKGLFRDIKASGPWDFILFDTISSLSASEYIDRSSSYKTTNALNSLASATGAAVIYNGHLTKSGGAGALKAGCTPAEVVYSAAGSGGLQGAARSMIVIAPRPAGVFDSVEKGHERDEVLVGACKSSVNPDWNMRLFPIIRDFELRTLRAVDANGMPLLMSEADREWAIQARLRDFVLLAVEALSVLRQPASGSPKGQFSLPKILTGALEVQGLTPEASIEQYQRAVDALERMGKIVSCKATRSGASGVWDIPTGDYAREADYEAEHGEKLEFRKGSPSLVEFRDAIDEIIERQADEGRPVAPIAPRATEAEIEHLEEEVASETSGIEDALSTFGDILGLEDDTIPE